MSDDEDQGPFPSDPRGRRASDWLRDPLDAVSDRIQRAINAWRYDVHDDEEGQTDQGHPDGVREHLRGTGEFYPQGSAWRSSPARGDRTDPPEYRGRRRAPRRRWWRFW